MGKFIEGAADMLWSAPVIFVLFSVFIGISCRSRFPQRRAPAAFSSIFREKGAYRALSVNLSAVLGIGNITGVALAVAAGGAGAVFWCFVSGVFGAGVQFAECLICAKHPRRMPMGTRGGPMYVLEKYGMKKSAAFYAVSVCACGLLIGAAIPSASAAEMLASKAGQGYGLYAGAALALPAFFILKGGSRRASDFCALVVPPLVLLYLAVCAFILFTVRARIFDALSLILRSAFAVKPALAGAGGCGFARAVRWGAARGLFSSEAGMGTAGIAAAEDADEGNALSRALSMSCSALIDTLFLSTLTGVCFVSASLHLGTAITDAQALISDTFSLFPLAGGIFISAMLVFLAFSTVIGWYHVAGRAYLYLFPESRLRVFTALWLIAVLTGPCMTRRALWSGCDVLMAMLYVPNLACILKVLPDCSTELDRIGGKRKKK